ncbi:hypothetical protein [Cellulomonas triticagri]|uniref:Uncharacterized protein n=1 Tax=Cellulomonas triticagri TaxID=2483352 RepID=A0A3M2JDL2_9CELL|nr:hypothetical protein [Cellulomonas triticagri]RMI09025.1 hypothetical protein EBM89_12050 [Cellulomonas triticagri]
MSTVPGDRTWQDAGLVEPALTDLPEVPADDDRDTPAPDDPRPDLEGEADPADVAEQRAAVPEDERDDYA